MKIGTMLLSFISMIAIGAESQFSPDFKRRFGPDSPIYNVPHFFSTHHMRNQKARPCKKRARKSLQERLHEKKLLIGSS